MKIVKRMKFIFTKNKKFKYKIKSLEGSAGKTILFNGLMWHRAGENASKEKNENNPKYATIKQLY